MIKLKYILNEGFKSEYKGNDSIIWKKGKTRGDVTNFTPYYKGHDIDTGGHNFKTEKELKQLSERNDAKLQELQESMNSDK